MGRDGEAEQVIIRVGSGKVIEAVYQPVWYFLRENDRQVVDCGNGEDCCVLVGQTIKIRGAESDGFAAVPVGISALMLAT